MPRSIQKFRQFINSEEGLTAVDCALILAAIFVAWYIFDGCSYKIRANMSVFLRSALALIGRIPGRLNLSFPLALNHRKFYVRNLKNSALFSIAREFHG